jgi:hypothetical protein
MMDTEVTVVAAARSDLYTNRQQCMLAVYGQHDQTCIQIGSSVCLQSMGGEWRLLRNNNTDATFVVAAFIRPRKVELNLSLRTP